MQIIPQINDVTLRKIVPPRSAGNSLQRSDLQYKPSNGLYRTRNLSTILTRIGTAVRDIQEPFLYRLPDETLSNARNMAYIQLNFAVNSIVTAFEMELQGTNDTLPVISEESIERFNAVQMLCNTIQHNNVNVFGQIQRENPGLAYLINYLITCTKGRTNYYLSEMDVPFSDVSVFAGLVARDTLKVACMLYDLYQIALEDQDYSLMFRKDRMAEYCLLVAANAGKGLLDNFGKAEAQTKIHIPGTDSSIADIVTQVDLDLQRMVAQELLARFPTAEFFGEEDPNKVFDPIADKDLIDRINSNRSEYQFVVDPLDGTGRYAARDARHSFLLGLLQGEQFIYCIGHAPMQGTTITAYRGAGATWLGKPFRFNSSIEDHVVVNSKIAKFYPDLMKELEEKGMHLDVPKHTGTMYNQLFLQYASGMISFRTNTHDHPLSLAVGEAGGYTLVYDGEQWVPGSEFNWRSEEAKKNANIPCYIAAKDKETAEGLAAIAEKYLKPPYSHWQNKRTGGVETYTCRYALGLKIYLSDSENGILRSTIMIVDGNTDIFFEPHGIQAQFHGQLSDGLELYARAIETLDKQHESLLALPKSVRDYYGIQAQKASGRLKQVFDCFI